MPINAAMPAKRFLAAVLAMLILSPGANAQPADGNVEEWRAELDRLVSEIDVSEERRDELRDEIASLDRDRAGLNQALIETNQTIQSYETQLDAIEARMAELATEEAEVAAALAERRDVLAEVLAVLQRMGRAPPPAIVIAPDDALAAVRSAILLGAVVPEMRSEAEALAADIERLIGLRRAQEEERDAVLAAAASLADEQERLELLIAERQQSLDQSNESLAGEQRRLGDLAAEADNLEDLIATFEGAGREPVVGVAPVPPAPIEPGPPILLGEADRISPAMPFNSARGLLPRPVAGDLVTGYGEADSLGNASLGLSIATRPGARVSSPADGWVEFAGPYRSYGNLLIVDAGDGYRIVLAGLERIDVQQGQFVLAGEPIGAMRTAQLAAANGAELGTMRPLLYVEFRKDGESINPGPWWADPF